jgi:hypothetical protein
MIRLPNLVRRSIWVLLAANIAVFAMLAFAIRANGLWRADQEEDAGGHTERHSTRVPCVYLDDEFTAPATLRSLGMEWQGYLELPTSGEYTFYTVGVGALDLQVGNRKIMANDRTGGRLSLRADVPLSRGVHPFRIRYEVPLPKAESTSAPAATAKVRVRRQMQLYWTMPGGGEYEQIIGRSWFYPTLPTAGRRLMTQLWRLKMGFVVVSLIILWWIGLHATLRLPRPEEAPRRPV